MGAFVPILALAKDLENFTSITTSFLRSLELDVIEIEDIQLFEERRKSASVVKEIEALATALTESAPVAVDTFQTYEQPDADE